MYEGGYSAAKAAGVAFRTLGGLLLAGRRGNLEPCAVHVLSRMAISTDLVEPAHPWECTPCDTDVSECLQPLPDWCPRMWYWLRRGPLARWGLEIGQCMHWAAVWSTSLHRVQKLTAGPAACPTNVADWIPGFCVFQAMAGSIATCCQNTLS